MIVPSTAAAYLLISSFSIFFYIKQDLSNFSNVVTIDYEDGIQLGTPDNLIVSTGMITCSRITFLYKCSISGSGYYEGVTGLILSIIHFVIILFCLDFKKDC